MFVGHGLLAFAIIAGLASWRGVGRERALAIGLLAGGFATVPDVDVLHPLFAVLVDPVPLGRFWALSTEVHRTATHSLVVGAIVAVGIAAWAAREDDAGSTRRAFLAGGGLAVLGGLVALVGVRDGPVLGAVIALLAAAGLALATLARRTGLGAGAVAAAAAVGLLSHPFGDLLTGQPPPLFYPVDFAVLTGRLSLHADQTLHLLGAFLVELATVWLALFVLASLSGVALRRQVGVRSLGGLGYAGAALVLPAPSLDAATPFVVSVLAVGLVGVTVRPARLDRWGAATTGLTAVTLAAVAYGVAYTLL